MRQIGALGALSCLTLACSLYHASPLPDLDRLSQGAPWNPDDLRAQLGAVDHPLLASAGVDLSDGLSPTEAAWLAVVLNPDLEAIRASRGQARAGLVTAGLLPNPVLNASVDHPYGGGSSGLTEAVALSLSIDTGQLVTLRARVSSAQAEVDRVDLDVLWQEWLVAQEARLEATRLGWLTRRVRLARDQLQAESETSERLQQGFDQGDVTADQLGVQITARESVRGNLVGLEQTRIETQNRLLALLGKPKALRFEIELPDPERVGPVPASDEVVPACLERRLDLAALRRGYDAQDARVWQAILEQFPSVTIGLAGSRNESRLDFLGGFVSLGVPVFARNQGGVALANATRQRLSLEYAARITAVRNAVDTALDLLTMLQARLPEVSAGIGPLEELEGDESVAASSGDVDWLTYVTIRLALFDQRLRQATLSQLAAETRIAFQTACGRFDGPLVASAGEAAIP